MKRPAAFTLKRINLTGDYQHVSSWSKVVDEGEPFLRTFNNKFLFKEEFGRLEHAVIPIYYRLSLRKDFFSFHFSNLRPPIRIMKRHCYLDWRQTVNLGDEVKKNKYKLYEEYEKDWFSHNFGSYDSHSIKFRSGRLVASMCKKFDVNSYCELPKTIQDQIKMYNERFKVVYEKSAPYLMIDYADPEMTDYIPNKDDLSWTPNFTLFFNDEKRLDL